MLVFIGAVVSLRLVGFLTNMLVSWEIGMLEVNQLTLVVVVDRDLRFPKWRKGERRSESWLRWIVGNLGAHEKSDLAMKEVR